MGIKITTDDRPVKVYRMDTLSFPVYSIRVSKKEGDHWVSAYQQIKFKKGIDVPNETMIHIKSAFPSVDSWVKEDKQYTKQVWQIMEFTYADEKNDIPTEWEEIP